MSNAIPTTWKSVQLDQLHPTMVARLEAFFDDARISGAVKVVSGVRTRASQAALFKKYRSGRTKVLAANPDRVLPGGWRGSFHMVQPADCPGGGYGHAVDLRIIKRRITTDEVATIARNFGLRQTVLNPFEWWHFQWRTADEVFPTSTDVDEPETPEVDWGGIAAFLADIGKAISRKALRRGSKGVEVKVCQSMLGNAGHDAGKPDGKFGRHTQRATKSLQKAAHLAQDGVLGKQSWGALLRAQP